MGNSPWHQPFEDRVDFDACTEPLFFIRIIELSNNRNKLIPFLEKNMEDWIIFVYMSLNPCRTSTRTSSCIDPNFSRIVGSWPGLNSCGSQLTSSNMLSIPRSILSISCRWRVWNDLSYEMFGAVATNGKARLQGRQYISMILLRRAF